MDRGFSASLYPKFSNTDRNKRWATQLITQYSIPSATLRWQDDQPGSVEFDDIYYQDDGFDEVARVFLNPSELPKRFAELAPNQTFTLAELGFGTGLNFALAADAFLQHTDSHSRLHFISMDAGPLATQDFARIWQGSRKSIGLAGELIEAYPPLITGWHQRTLARGRITLSLYWGDAQCALADLLEQQHRGVDAWFLDGFAPERNAAMWQAELLTAVAGTCRTGSTVATFTAVGRVRRQLSETGFQMRRVDQQPHKRESLAGVMTAVAPTKRPPLPAAKAATVVGIGIAGCSVARHLADAGVSVNLLDPGANSSAVNISTTVLHPRLLTDDSLEALLRATGYLYASQFVRSHGHRLTGTIQTIGPNMTNAKLELLGKRYTATGDWLQLLEPTQATELAGRMISGTALFYPGSGVINPAALCVRLQDHPNIHVSPLIKSVANVVAEGLDNDTPTVLANALGANQCEYSQHFEMAEIQGQLEVVRFNEPPKIAIVGTGYLAPTSGNRAVVGATFEHAPWSVELATQSNMQNLPAASCQWLGRERGSRAVSSDRLPIAGRVDAPPKFNLYASTAHGSTGMTSAHYCAAVVSRQILGEIGPMDSALTQLLSPNRFHARQRKRGPKMGAIPRSKR